MVKNFSDLLSTDDMSNVTGGFTAEPVIQEPLPEQPPAPTYTTDIGNLVNKYKGDLESAGITGHRLNYFLAQTAHESGGFRHLTELDPSKSNLSDKGGERYKGRGIMQLTGVNNYRYYGQQLGLDLVNNPDLAADPDNSMKIAIEYWKQNKLNDYADRGDLRGMTRVINGPAYTQNSFLSRKSWYDRVAGIESDDPASIADKLASQLGKPVKLPKQGTSALDSDREEERALSTATKVYRRADESWFPSVTNAYERASLSQASEVREVTKRKADEAFARVQELTKIAPPEKGYIESFSDWAGFTPLEVETAQERKRFNEYLETVKAQNPNVALPYQSYDDIALAATTEIVSRKELADEQIDNIYTEGGALSDVGTFVGSLAGGMGGFLSDWENAKIAATTAVVTGGASIAGQIAANVGVNVLQESIADVNARAVEEQIGVERTFEETAQNMVSAAAVGAAVPVIGRGLKAAIQHFKGKPEAQVATKALNEVIENETGVSPDMSPFGDSPTGSVKLDAVINRELTESAKTGLTPAPVPDAVIGVKTPEVEIKLQEHDDLIRSVAETPEEKQLAEEIIQTRRAKIENEPSTDPRKYEDQVKNLSEQEKQQFKENITNNSKDIKQLKVSQQATEKRVRFNESDLKAKDVYLKDLKTQLDTIAEEATETSKRYDGILDKSSEEAMIAREQLKTLGERYEGVEAQVRTVTQATDYLKENIDTVRETLEFQRADLEKSQAYIDETNTKLQALDSELAAEVDTSSARYGVLKAQQAEIQSGLKAANKVSEESRKTLLKQEKRLSALENRYASLTETTQNDLAKFETALKKTDESVFKTELALRKEKLQRVIAEHEANIQKLSEKGEEAKVQWEDADGLVREGTVAEYRVDIDSDKKALDMIVGCATNIGA